MVTGEERHITGTFGQFEARNRNYKPKTLPFSNLDFPCEMRDISTETGEY